MIFQIGDGFGLFVYFEVKSGANKSRIKYSPHKYYDASSEYRCEDCHGCPYRAQCCKARDPEQQKEIVVCREFADYRQESLERITTEEGKLLRVNRSIQSEGSFGQLKHNRRFIRFLTGGNVKVSSELYFLGLSQNLLKRISKCNARKTEIHLLSPKSLLKF